MLFGRGVKIQYKGNAIGELTIKCPMLSGFGNTWRFPVYEITDDYVVVEKGVKVLVKREMLLVYKPARGMPRDFLIIDLYVRRPPEFKGDVIIVEPYHPDAIKALAAISDEKKFLDVIDDMAKRYNERIMKLTLDVVNARLDTMDEDHKRALELSKDLSAFHADLIRRIYEYSKLPGKRLVSSYQYYTTRELAAMAKRLLPLIDAMASELSRRTGMPKGDIAQAILDDPFRMFELMSKYVKEAERPRLGLELVRPRSGGGKAGKKVKSAGGEKKGGEEGGGE